MAGARTCAQSAPMFGLQLRGVLAPPAALRLVLLGHLLQPVPEGAHQVLLLVLEAARVPAPGRTHQGGNAGVLCALAVAYNDVAKEWSPRRLDKGRPDMKTPYDPSGGEETDDRRPNRAGGRGPPGPRI